MSRGGRVSSLLPLLFSRVRTGLDGPDFAILLRSDSHVPVAFASYLFAVQKSILSLFYSPRTMSAVYISKKWYNIIVGVVPLAGGKELCTGRPNNSSRRWRCGTTRACRTGRRSPTPNRSGFAGPNIFAAYNYSPERTTLGLMGEGVSLYRNNYKAARAVPGAKQD